MREQLLRGRTGKNKQLQLQTMHKVVLIDLKVNEEYAQNARSFFSQKLQHVLMRLKSVRWGRRYARGAFDRRSRGCGVESTIPTLLIESKILKYI